MTGKTLDYSGRQLDMELLQHVEEPVDQRVFPSIDHDMDELRRSMEEKLGRPPTDDELSKAVADRIESGGSFGPRICAGMEKVVQRYAKLLLTDLGSVRFDPELGNGLLSSIRRGEVYSEAWVNHLFNEANRNVLNAMKIDDNDTASFGPLPDDERIDSAELAGLEIDEASASIRIHVRIATLAGESYEYVVPVASGVS